MEDAKRDGFEIEFNRGIEEAYEMDFGRGIKIARVEMISNMIKRDWSFDTIADIMKLPIEEAMTLAEEVPYIHE